MMKSIKTILWHPVCRTQRVLFSFIILLFFTNGNLTKLHAQNCMPGDFLLTAQADVDDFQANHGPCTTVTGNLTITGGAINDLSGLSGLTSVGGNLKIFDNPILTNVDGLSGLTSVGKLQIFNVPSLTNVDGLSGLTGSVGDDLIIKLNDNLTNVDGLSGLTSVGDNVDLSFNDNLTNVDGLSGLTSVGGNLSIDGNDNLTNVDGLSGLTSVGEDLSINSNPLITNVDGLSGLTSVGLSLRIVNNAELTSIDGLSGLTGSIVGHLEIINNDKLTNVDALSGLTSVGLALRIRFNDNLTNVDALSGLTSVGSHLLIDNNSNLSACCGLNALFNGGTIGGVIFMFNNAGNCNNGGADITPENCIPPYVLVATDGDLEFDQCIAQAGGIGIMSDDEAEIEDYAEVTAAGTFVKAPEIDVDNTSNVTVQIFEPADPVLPMFRYNNMDGGDDVDVDDGETVTLTGNVYDDIDVGDDATIIFQGHSDIYIDDFETEDNVTIVFLEPCTNVMLEGKMKLGKDNLFNASITSVTVFAEEKIEIKKRAEVYGNLYTKDKFETKKSSSSQPSIFWGMFIGEEVEANEYGIFKYVPFNTNCSPPPPMIEHPVVDIPNNSTIPEEVEEVEETELIEEEKTEETQVFNEYRLYPNPAANNIFLAAKKELNGAATFRITDVRGNLVMEQSYLNLRTPKMNFDVSDFPGGIYILYIQAENSAPVAKKFVVEK